MTKYIDYTITTRIEIDEEVMPDDARRQMVAQMTKEMDRLIYQTIAGPEPIEPGERKGYVHYLNRNPGRMFFGVVDLNMVVS